MKICMDANENLTNSEGEPNELRTKKRRMFQHYMETKAQTIDTRGWNYMEDRINTKNNMVLSGWRAGQLVFKNKNKLVPCPENHTAAI